jgi:predicted peptidase
MGNKEAFEAAFAVTTPEIWKSPNGGTLPYRMHIPAKIEPGRTYPLVIHMHGVGSRGTNNLNQLRNGGADFIAWAKRQGEEFVFVAPQCPAEMRWVDSLPRGKKHTMKESPTPAMRMAMEIIDDVRTRYPVDQGRIYVMGISMGGHATWELLQRRPELFAAALPCCGGGDSALASRLVDIPIWAFHGDRDRTVSVVRSRDMVAAIKAAGGTKIKYREYPGKGHNVWTPTFSDDSVFEWLFSQRRKQD